MVRKVLNEILERQKERFISLYEICNFLGRELGTNPKDILIYLHGLEKQNRNRETINLYDIDNLGFYQPSKTTLHKIVSLNPVNFDFNKNKNKIEKFFIDADEFASLSFIKDSHIFPTNHKAIKLINNLRIEGKLRKSLAKLTRETSQEWQDNLLTKMEILLLENEKLNRQLLQSPNKTIAELKQHNNELRDFIDSKLDSVSNDLLNQAQETNRIILEQGLKEIRNPSPLEDKLDDIIERIPNNDNHVTSEQRTSDRTKDISQPNSESDTPADRGQGDSLLILGAVMSTIEQVAKTNYTQASFIENHILPKYGHINGISESTLQKKFSQAKTYLKQKV